MNRQNQKKKYNEVKWRYNDSLVAVAIKDYTIQALPK